MCMFGQLFHVPKMKECFIDCSKGSAHLCPVAEIQNILVICDCSLEVELSFFSILKLVELVSTKS